MSWCRLVVLCQLCWTAVHGLGVRYNTEDAQSLVHGRPITMDPPDATCRPRDGSSETVLEYFYGDFIYKNNGAGSSGDYYNGGGERTTIYCRNDCPKTFPVEYTTIDLIGTGESPLELGYPGCLDVPEVLRPTVTTLSPIGLGGISKRRGSGVCGVVTSASDIRSLGRTFTFWINPDVTNTNGTLLSAMTGPLRMYSLELENRRLVLRAMGNPRPYRRSEIPPRQWTHIALQIDIGQYVSSMALYVNGTLLRDPLVLRQQNRFRRAVRQGDGSLSDPVFLGISGSPYFHGHACHVSRVEQCQRLHYSPYVSTQTADLQYLEENAQRLLRLAARTCSATPTHIRDGYICSSVLPTCARSGAPMQPCRSACLEYFSSCGLNDTMLLSREQCGQLPVTNCVTTTLMNGQRVFTPEYGMFRGSMRDVNLVNGVLTEREIAHDYSGVLPDLEVRPECLCPERTSRVETDLVCSGNTTYDQPFARLGENVFVPEAIIDRHWPWSYTDTTNWYSAENVDHVEFVVDFNRRKLLKNLTIETPKGFDVLPANVTVQLLDENRWKDIAYIARDCSHVHGKTFQDITGMGEAMCSVASTYTSMVSIGLLSDGRAGVEFLPSRFTGSWEIHPIVQEFLSGTAVRVILDGFISPRNRFFGLTDFSVNGWNTTEDACECFDGGLAAGVNPKDPCDESGRCRCRPDAGDPALTQYTCYPYTGPGASAVIPNYGPESGGTIVIINGGYFGTGNVSVYHGVGGVRFDVINVTETQITCRTPNVTGSPLYRPIPLLLELYENTNHAISLLMDQTFEFREDPVIESITPLSTFLRGGINQTVVGQFLDSVYAPFITVTIVYTSGGQSEEYAQPPSTCSVLNGTVMVCQSPDVRNLPEEYQNYLVGQLPQANDVTRRKRSTAVEESQAIGHREKRQSDDIAINKEDFQFYVGFLLDGVETYRNVSEPLPEYGIIQVFTNPEIYPWPSDDRVRVFQPYKGDSDILIEGERMTFGCTLKDYVIQIGEGFCEVEDLFANALSCRPPKDRPDLGATARGGAPRVIATVGNIRQLIGYLEYHETPWDDPRVKGAILGVVFAVLIIIIIIIIVVILRKKRALRRKQAGMNKYSEPPTAWAMLPASVKAELQPCMKTSDSLKLGRKVGQGNFGTVYVGRFNDEKKGAILVAAKTIKDKGVTVKELLEFLEEATLMKDFSHENVLHLVGVLLQDDVPYVLLPLMEYGDLRTFLLKPDNQFTVRDLLDYGLQVAKGMEYLSHLKFVHRDLAARNCMVSKENVVKVADFGLARDIYSNEYYRVENKSRPLPVKWMAPEALDDFKFTTKSDVWSYGVLMWELLTRGKKPYSHVDNFDLKNYLRQGSRLDKPAVAPDEVYELMLQCWNMNPANRPEFTQIAREMNRVLLEDDESESHGDLASKPGEEFTSPEYQRLDQYVDYTTDRHGYEHMHTEQGYLDMEAGQIDYVQAAKELGIDSGYLAPVGSQTTKPKPQPRTSLGKGHRKGAASHYQNMEALRTQSQSSEVNGNSAVKAESKVMVPAPEDSETSNVPIYMNAQLQNVQFSKEC